MIAWWWLIPVLFIGGFLGYQNGLATAREQLEEALREKGIDPDTLSL